MSRKFRVAIIGAGISGLSAAYFLKKKSVDEGLNLDLNIIERSNRPGGVIRTEAIQDLFLEVATEVEQLDYPVLYASARDGYVTRTIGEQGEDMSPLFNTINIQTIKLTNLLYSWSERS